MRKTRTALFAVLVIAGVALAGIEVLGIEVLGIEVLSDGSQLAHTLSTAAPAGSMVYAVMNTNGNDTMVDVEPVNPYTGLADVLFPFEHTNNKVELRDAAGVLLAIELLGGEMAE